MGSTLRGEREWSGNHDGPQVAQSLQSRCGSGRRRRLRDVGQWEGPGSIPALSVISNRPKVFSLACLCPRALSAL